mgnify:CR=1 FL=1
MVLVPGSLVLGLFYFFAVQYYLSKAAVSGGKVRVATATLLPAITVLLL